MPTDTPLPGLDRIIAICRRHSFAVKLPPPLVPAPQGGDLLFGEPLDPQLAAVYQRLGGAELGPLTLYRPGGEWLDLVPWNERLREDGELHFRASLVFGQETGFAFYFATVPRLANSQGIQPVIYIEAMEMLTCAPVASSIDRFFDTYSRYLELIVMDPEYIHHRVPEASFPWGVADLISRDEFLVDQVRSGHFDFLTQEDDDAHNWLQKLCASGTPQRKR